MEPDLLLVTATERGRRTLHIVDAKSSGAVKVSHQVQVALYALALTRLLQELNLSRISIATHGIVWLPPSEPNGPHRAEPFTLALLLPQVEHFLLHKEGKLAQVFGANRNKASWHFDPRACLGCPGIEACEKEATEKGEVSLVPGVSVADAASLKALIARYPPHPSTQTSWSGDIEDLAALLSRSSPEQPTSGLLIATSNDTLPTSDKALLRRALQVKLPEAGLPTPQYVPMPSTLEALRTKSLQLRKNPTPALARSEDCALLMALVVDPYSQRLAAWVLQPLVFTAGIGSGGGIGGGEEFLKMGIACRSDSQDDVPTVTDEECKRLTSKLIGELKSQFGQAVGKTVTVYTFSGTELTQLKNLCIEAAVGDDIRVAQSADMCARVLVTDVRAIHLLSPPDTILGKRSAPDPPTDNEDRDGGSGCEAAVCGGSGKQPKASLLAPRCVALQDALAELVAVPFSRANTLGGALAAFSGNMELARQGGDQSFGDLLGEWARGNAEPALVSHVKGVQTLLTQLRAFVTQGERDSPILLSAAQHLDLPQLTLRDTTIRRMVFVRQLEAIAKGEAAQRARISGLVRLKFIREVSLPEANKSFVPPGAPGLIENGSKLLLCEVLEGADLLQNANEEFEDSFTVAGTGAGGAPPVSPSKNKFFSFNKFLLSRPESWPAKEQLAFTDVNFLSKFQHPDSPEHPIALAAVVRFPCENREHQGGQSRHVLIAREANQKGEPPKLVKELQSGVELALSGREYDGNTEKVVNYLRRVDTKTEESSLLRLLNNPVAFANKVPFPSLSNSHISCNPGDPLAMEDSQEKAFQSVVSRSATVVWGPPGTGKSHCLAATILRLVRAAVLGKEKGLRVLFTGFSNSAIDELSNKIDSLADKVAASGDDTQWLAALPPIHGSHTRVLRFVTTTNVGPTAEMVKSFSVSAGTQWAIQNKLIAPLKAPRFDVVVIDEASQVLVSDAALALEVLSPSGRLVIAGDDEQLGPILQLPWPRTKLTPVHLSILECLRASNAQCQQGAYNSSIVHQLTACRRLNRELVGLSQTIYGPNLKSVFEDRCLVRRNHTGAFAGGEANPQQGEAWVSSTHPLHEALNALLGLGVGGGCALLRVSLPSPQGAREDTLLREEALAAAELVVGLLTAASAGGEPPEQEGAKPRPLRPQDFYVVTPHRKQRKAVRCALMEVAELARLPPSDTAELIKRVDTTEKIQGQECDVVLCCWGSMDSDILANEADFALNRSRLNVSVTRARRAAVLLLSSALETPSLASGALLSRERQKGTEYLHAFAERAKLVKWRGNEDGGRAFF